MACIEEAQTPEKTMLAQPSSKNSQGRHLINLQQQYEYDLAHYRAYMALRQFHESIANQRGKLCFVTIGATADFDSLIRAVLSETFIQALEAHSYTDLLIQYGKDESGVYRDFQEVIRDGSRTAGGLRIQGFGFNVVGLGQEMRAVKGGRDGREGVVISHAGSGSILAALRIDAPLIVVPNPHLLDNHQVELAEELARQGYVTHGKLESVTLLAKFTDGNFDLLSSDLAASLGELEQKRNWKNAWPPDNSKVDPEGKGVEGVMADQLGFVD